jgi:glyoxylase-like metal-dependent hydrolase (beta-lactamase superfamily II)
VKILDGIHLVGSGTMGLDLTDPYDCHIFLIDGGSELALIDTGAGMGVEGVLANIRSDGFDPARVRQIVLTHAHVDHAGGVARMRGSLGSPSVLCHAAASGWVETADEARVSLDVAKKAGFYPPEYVLEPCPVDAELSDGDRVRIGNLELTVIETPGHADGHVSLLLERRDERILLAGDAIFFGGHILLQNTWDCRLDAQIATLRRLRDLEVTALIPSHLAWSLRNGQRHIERANDALDRLLIPNQLISAW